MKMGRGGVVLTIRFVSAFMIPNKSSKSTAFNIAKIQR